MSTASSIDSSAFGNVLSIRSPSQQSAQYSLSPPVNMDMSPATNSPLYSSLEQSSESSFLLQSRSDVDSLIQVDADSESGSSVDVDQQILEALRSNKDRLYVLKLGEQMEALIQERNSRSKFDLSPETTYQRLLVHRCAAYYKLTPELDSVTRIISVSVTTESKLPPKRFSDLVPFEEVTHPKFQIMRRSDQDRKRTKTTGSYPGSSVGDEGEGSDPEPSENGSMGSRSTTSRKRMTIAEREAAYQEARMRIFMDYDEKGNNKERNGSASSSSLSLVSASGSTSNGGSIDGYEEYINSPYAESDWSDGITRDNPHGRRGGYVGSGGSSRGLRNTSFNTLGSVNARGSGTSSPAFTYPSLYEQPQVPYDSSQGYPPPLPGGYMAPFPMYPYPAPGQAASQPYLAPYTYYPPYPLPPPQFPPSKSTNSDHSSPSTTPADMYQQQPYNQNMGYGPYMWPNTSSPPHFNPSAVASVQSPPIDSQNNPSQIQNQQPPPGQNPIYSSPPPNQYQPAPYASYVPPPHPYNYAMPPYYGPHHYPQQPPVQTQSQPMYPADMSSQVENNNVNDYNNAHPRINGAAQRAPPRNEHNNGQDGNQRPSAPAARAAWSYGPGVGIGGLGPTHSNTHYSPAAGENVGPRLSSSVRRTSASSGSGSGGNRTPADETSSTTSSSTSSSSSRRTYLSTSTSSKHPLPPRPDWAAGLMPQSQNRHRHSNHGSRNMSPARSPNRQPPQQLPPIYLQSNDFPPLSMSANAGKRNTPAGGAWNNQSNRSVFTPNPIDATINDAHGNALAHYYGNGGSSGRLDDIERSFERPPPKPNAELFNPKSANASKAPSPSAQEKADGEKDRARNETIANAILVDRIGSLKIQGPDGGKLPDNVEEDHINNGGGSSRTNGNNDLNNNFSQSSPLTKDISSSGITASYGYS